MTYKTGSIGEFARWTKQVAVDPQDARDVPKRWFDSTATASTAAEREASPKGLVKLLSDDNRALLQIIGREKPGSIQALADLVGRRQSNLSRTLRKLEAAGIIRLDRGPKRTVAPVLLAARLRLDLDLIENKEVLISTSP